MLTCWVGDQPQNIQLAVFCDASFSRDLRDSKSTSGELIALIGPHTYVPLTWFTKKQRAVSHSSTEAELIALDAALRLDGCALLYLWQLITEVYYPEVLQNEKAVHKPVAKTNQEYAPNPINQALMQVDYVPCNVPKSRGSANLIVFEDNEAVIKMCIKGRSVLLRHVIRTHRVNLDWIFERMRTDPGMRMKYIRTIFQVADILTKGGFSADQWKTLCTLCSTSPSLNAQQPRPSLTPQQNVMLMRDMSHEHKQVKVKPIKHKPVNDNNISIATDCSGMEAPIQALRNLQVLHEHLFSRDHDPKVQKFIRANFPVKHFYNDITTRDQTNTPHAEHGR